MEAEKRKEEKFVMEKVEWSKSRTYTNNIKKESLIRNVFHTPCSTSRPSAPRNQMEKCAAEVNVRCGQSPKRKNNFDTISQGSPAKIRKTNTFSQNLNYWKNIENMQVVPTDSALLTKSKTENFSHTRLSRSEVVKWLDSPGKLNGGLAEGIVSE